MKTAIYKGDVRKLRDITDEWLLECRCNDFGISVDTEKQLDDLQKMVDGNGSALIVLLDGDNNAVGYLGIVVIDSPIGKQMIANEHYWYVCRHARGIGSLRLLVAAEEWAMERGCSHLIMNASVMASSLCDSVCKLYERLGMAKFETSYIKLVQ